MVHPKNLVVIETHPIQYHAPIYRAVQECGIPVTVIYGSDFSVVGYRDPEFGTTFAWDTDLLSGYTSLFLSRVADGGATSAETTTADKLGAVLGQTNAAAILLTGYSPRFYQHALYHAWRSGLPILFRAETTDHASPRTSLKTWTRSRVLRAVYNRCHHLLYVGQRSSQHFQALGYEDEKLVFAPYCVDTAVFECGEDARNGQRAERRHDLEISDGDIVLLLSGKLSTRKGPDLLVRAVKSLDAGLRRRIVMVFLGGGELAGTLKDLAAAVPEVRARFVGFKNQRELSPYYHASDVLVLPSRSGETWGLVVNEALHHGLPCVVSRAVGCAPDLVEAGVTGEIAETDSVESLTDTLVRSLNLVGRAEIRTQCRQRVSGYTVDRAADGIARAYRAIVD